MTARRIVDAILTRASVRKETSLQSRKECIPVRDVLLQDFSGLAIPARDPYSSQVACFAPSKPIVRSLVKLAAAPPTFIADISIASANNRCTRRAPQWKHSAPYRARSRYRVII